MLQNMAKHLARLDYSSLTAIETALRSINLLMARAEGIAFEIDRTEQEFARLYQKDYAATVTTDDLSRDDRARGELPMGALSHTIMSPAQGVHTDSESLVQGTSVSGRCSVCGTRKCTNKT